MYEQCSIFLLFCLSYWYMWFLITWIVHICIYFNVQYDAIICVRNRAKMQHLPCLNGSSCNSVAVTARYSNVSCSSVIDFCLYGERWRWASGWGIITLLVRGVTRLGSGVGRRGAVDETQAQKAVGEWEARERHMRTKWGPETGNRQSRTSNVGYVIPTYRVYCILT